MRRAKIIATLGPASNTRDKIQELVRAGADIFRLNFSHGTHEEHAKVAQLVHDVAAAEKRNLAILQDLPGPKIRTGRLRQRRPVLLKEGDQLRLTPEDIQGTSSRLHVNYPHLARDARRGDRILLADGLIELRVKGRDGNDLVCLVRNGGLLGERKGVNLPGVKLRIPALTDADEDHLKFGLEQGFDYVALSFVRSAKDVQAVKTLITRAGRDTPVIAKLEKPEAIEDLDNILAVADGVMLARGDLGVEMPPEKVPVVQKYVIEQASACKVPIITATQMLESMTASPRPTRAEASDVANAIFDGTDAIMLSGETAAGQYPCEAVQMMARIALEAEGHMARMGWRRRPRTAKTITETICESVAHATGELDVKAVVVFTRSGSTARMISKYRPVAPIYAFCHDVCMQRRLALYWGVTSWHMPLTADSDTTMASAERILLHEKRVQPGDVLAFVAGDPFGPPGSTNLMKLVVVRDRRNDES